MAAIRVTIGSHTYTATVRNGVVSIDGVAEPFIVAATPDGRWTVLQGTTRVTAAAAATPDAVWVTAAGHTARAEVDAAGARPRGRTSDTDVLRPPMPATVVRVQVQSGQAVEEGDVLVVLEAMKMELPVRAPRAGTVSAIHCREGELVQPTMVLLDLE